MPSWFLAAKLMQSSSRVHSCRWKNDEGGQLLMLWLIILRIHIGLKPSRALLLPATRKNSVKKTHTCILFILKPLSDELSSFSTDTKKSRPQTSMTEPRQTKVMITLYMFLFRMQRAETAFLND